MKHKKIIFAGILSLLLLAGCGTKDEERSASDDSKKTSVVATNSIIADMVKEVGAGQVSVKSLVPVGTDPHEYEPLPEDIKQASEADVVFYNGLNLETGNGWFNKLMETADKKENEDYFAVSKEVEPIHLTGNTKQEDPHAWLNISNGILYVKEIQHVLSEKDPENKDSYQKNADAYIKQLEELDTTAKDAFADIPNEKKLLVTSEGAFKYFSKAYDLTAAYIWEINTESQGTPEQMKQVVEKVRASKVPALFVETSVDKRSMERLSKEVGLPIYSELYTDSLAKKGAPGDSYYKMMKWNLEKIHEGLME
ncbi:MAG: metal ABC transporter substrate-binding protein [Enterococcus viikkiensis]|uniref:Metal ABC transporter substrate-binding protein n=1 Tax=Enterococcus viikkiensis TaxID=930854 RepID=A0ABU3FS70_9ENTE|nr:metal ABC transporter substrate-binding protein [Enterococcus viikkiensis]MDT2828816.1 metal ABC transporter substrate-binding protein [Enterococcus viikkiensis]